MKQQKLNKEQQKAMVETAKKQRNLEELQAMLYKNIQKMDSIAYRIETTKSKKKRVELETKFDKHLYLVLSLQTGNFSLSTH